MRTEVFALLLLTGCSDPLPSNADRPNPSAIQTPESTIGAAARASAETALRAEPKAKDVLWSGATLYVGVLDDGSRRDGYAMYVCDVLREHDAAKGVTVIMKDIVESTKGHDVQLGKARC